MIDPSEPCPRQRTSTDRLPRCCAQHPDWPTLSQHLVIDFADVPITDVVREIRSAKDAVTAAGLSLPDALRTGELIARHQLMMLSGRSEDVARLDPMTRDRRPSDSIT